MQFSRKMKKLLVGLLATTQFGGPTVGLAQSNVGEVVVPELSEVFNVEVGQTPKNVIVLIPDGMGTSNTGALRQYLSDGTEITALDRTLVGQMITTPENPDDLRNVTDSAAAGTAMATGEKTYSGAIGVDNDGSRLTNLSEIAKSMGKSVGSVATADMTHATPAAFLAHNESRNNNNEIADSYIDDRVDGEIKIDVMLGGGTDFFIREDRNLIEEFQDEGYDYVETKEDMLNAEGDKLIGLFAPKGMPKYWDMDEETPSLSEMTWKAIDVLSRNEDGFFLMVEGSQIDWANHDNDPVGLISEMEDFNNAYEIALNFAIEDGETLIISAADHDCGGFGMAGYGGDDRWNPEPLRQMSKTPEYIATAVEEAGTTDVLSEYIEWELTSSELQAIEDAIVTGDAYEVTYTTIIEGVNTRTNSGWTSGDHTGGDVSMYAYGPGWEKFVGINDNTDVANNVKQLWDFDETAFEETTEEESSAA